MRSGVQNEAISRARSILARATSGRRPYKNKRKARQMVRGQQGTAGGRDFTVSDDSTYISNVLRRTTQETRGNADGKEETENRRKNSDLHGRDLLLDKGRRRFEFDPDLLLTAGVICDDNGRERRTTDQVDDDDDCRSSSCYLIRSLQCFHDLSLQ